MLSRALIAVSLCCAFSPLVRPAVAAELLTADGYRGIWYMNTPTKNEYVYKYAGGYATYPQQHAPIAIYAKAVDKTFFVFGGTTDPQNQSPSLLYMLGVFDHASGTFCKPRILLDKKTTDAHDNATLAIGGDGHLLVFGNAHGRTRPAYVFRSTNPYSIDAFEEIWKGNYSYGDPWVIPGVGVLLLHTHYENGNDHNLFWSLSPDGKTWPEPSRFATFGKGHYQISWSDPRNPKRVATAFDFHPNGLDSRTNLYYLETSDGGKTWQTADGKKVQPPLLDKNNPALVTDYQSQKLNVYLKDLQFDADGRPVILVLTSKGAAPGPANAPYQWRTTRWTGKAWETRDFTTSDHNYDHGSLYIRDGRWMVIAPTDPGPAPYATGGDLVVWTSADQGATWKKERVLTPNAPRHQTYLRRPLNYKDDFAAIWADGDARKPSESFLYFTDIKAEKVWRLPAKMTGDAAKGEEVRY